MPSLKFGKLFSCILKNAFHMYMDSKFLQLCCYHVGPWLVHTRCTHHDYDDIHRVMAHGTRSLVPACVGKDCYDIHEFKDIYGIVSAQPTN